MRATYFPFDKTHEFRVLSDENISPRGIYWLPILIGFIEYFGHKSVTRAFHCCMQGTFVLFLGQNSICAASASNCPVSPSLGTPHTLLLLYTALFQWTSMSVDFQWIPQSACVRPIWFAKLVGAKKCQLHSFPALVFLQTALFWTRASFKY